MKLSTITARKLVGVGCYGDACAAAHALELVGERWALLVIRELMLGPRRFSDLRNCLPMLSANVLTQRLRALEAAGVVQRSKLPAPVSSKVYELTQWGYESEPVIIALGRWGARSSFHDPALAITPTALMLSLRAMFAPRQASGVDVKAQFVMDAEHYAATVAHGEIAVARGEQSGSDIVFDGPPQVIAQALYANPSLARAERSGLVLVTGNRAAAEGFFRLFPLPQKNIPQRSQR